MQTIREKLELEDWEYLVGTFWDKDSSVRVYKPTNKKLKVWEVRKEFEKKFTKAWWFKVKNDKIAKRETALWSVWSVFDDIDIGHNYICIKKDRS